MKFLPVLVALLVAACGELEPLVAAPVMDNAQCRAEALRAPDGIAARQYDF